MEFGNFLPTAVAIYTMNGMNSELDDQGGYNKTVHEYSGSNYPESSGYSKPKERIPREYNTTFEQLVEEIENERHVIEKIIPRNILLMAIDGKRKQLKKGWLDAVEYLELCGHIVDVHSDVNDLSNLLSQNHYDLAIITSIIVPPTSTRQTNGADYSINCVAPELKKFKIPFILIHFGEINQTSNIPGCSAIFDWRRSLKDLEMVVNRILNNQD